MTLITYLNAGKIKYLAGDSQQTFHITIHNPIKGMKLPKAISINKIYRIGENILGYSGRTYEGILNILLNKENDNYDKIINQIDSARIRYQPHYSDGISSGGTFKLIVLTNQITKELIFNPGQELIENTITKDFCLNETHNKEILYKLWDEIHDSNIPENENIENY